MNGANNQSDLYNSTYSVMAEKERNAAIRKLLHNFDCKNKSVLEIGAGHGNNISLLRECGFKKSAIFVNEIREDRISFLKQNHPEIALIEGDATIVEFPVQFDLVFQSTVFTSILEEQKRQMLAEKMWSLLNPGGCILWYDFIYNNPRNPNVKKVSEKEVIQLFPEAEHVTIKKVTLGPPVGRRVGKLYDLFNLPFLRSHILALFQKP